MLSIAIAFLLGGIGWTFTEYTLHRWGAHEGANKLEFRVEHLAHHARTSYFAPTSKKVWAATRAVVPMAAIGWFAVGWPGVSFALGYVLVYGFYELVHRRIHTHPPRGPYSRLVRKHHLAHHFVNARSNHGVTSPVWDIVFRTRLDSSAPVRVPTKLAPLWLFDADGDVRSAFSCDYERRGRRARVSSPHAPDPAPPADVDGPSASLDGSPSADLGPAPTPA